MLSKITNYVPSSIEKEYPYLGCLEYDDNSILIVLFNGPGTGMVVFSEYTADSEYFIRPIGEFKNYWMEEQFKNFTGDITLKN